jgi:hypothetical protein
MQSDLILLTLGLLVGAAGYASLHAALAYLWRGRGKPVTPHR